MSTVTTRVLIIGAGLTGAGLLRDLALRGCRPFSSSKSTCHYGCHALRCENITHFDFPKSWACP